MKKELYVYILQCSDGTYYTGVTNDLDRRVGEHNTEETEESKKSYVYSRRPAKLVFAESFSEYNDAIEFEKKIKGWRREKKEAMIQGNYERLIELSKTAKDDYWAAKESPSTGSG